MKSKINWSLYGTAFSVNLISLMVGGTYSWTSPVLPKLKGNNSSNDNPFGAPITPFEESWIVSMVGLGGSIGPFLSTAVVDRIGRKKTLLLVAIPMIMSYLVLAFSTEIYLYYLCRFFMGLGVGCVYSIVPVYIGEIAEDSNRGALGCFINIFCTAGTVFSLCVGPYVTIKTFSLLLLIPVSSFLIIFGIFAPESPYYWLMVNKEEQAKAALQKLRNEIAKEELEEIRKNIEQSRDVQFKFSDLTKSRVILRGMLICSGLVFFQQFSGICVIIMYMQPIFEASGSSISPEISSIIIGVIQTFINFGTSLLVDRVGRRILLLTSLVGSFLSLALIGFYFYLKDNNYQELVDSLYWLPVCSVIFYVVMYSAGIGTVPWAILGEVFPSHVRSVASTFVSALCFFLGFVLTVFFPNLSQMIGMSFSFWIFAGCCLVGFVFVWKMVPETKGKSLQKIQLLLEG